MKARGLIRMAVVGLVVLELLATAVAAAFPTWRASLHAFGLSIDQTVGRHFVLAPPTADDACSALYESMGRTSVPPRMVVVQTDVRVDLGELWATLAAGAAATGATAVAAVLLRPEHGRVTGSAGDRVE